MRSPVTATRTGDEFHVGNNGGANQSKYPMELRACLTRQKFIKHLRYLPYLPYPTLQFSEEWVRGRKLMACLTP